MRTSSEFRTWCDEIVEADESSVSESNRFIRCEVVDGPVEAEVAVDRDGKTAGVQVEGPGISQEWSGDADQIDLHEDGLQISGTNGTFTTNWSHIAARERSDSQIFEEIDIE